MQLIKKVVKNKMTILIVGGAGSGKTTLANAIISEMAKYNERIVMIEDTLELQCKADDCVSLRVKEGIADMTDLLKSRSKSNENSVEFWDSFGELSVLWIDENQKDELENASKFVKQIISQLPSTKKKDGTNNSSNENTSDRKRFSKKKRKEKFEYSDKDKMEIVIKPKDEDENSK